jgi:DNA polymerase-3 subunit alpha
MNPQDFVHLHVHSQYSLLHGAIFIDRLVAQVKQFGMRAVAVTDHVNLFGAVEFYEKAKKEGVQSILGCEIYYLTKGSRLDRTQKPKDHELAHLILLVENEEGYQNLCQLISASHLEGFYYKPRIDKEILSKHSKGLFALSACAKGEIPRKIIEGRVEEAKIAAKDLAQIFPDHFYLELQDHGLSHEKLVNEAMVEMSKALSIPLVVTNNAHYLKRENREAHEALLCIQTGNMLKEEDRLSYDGDEFYLKSPEEMCELFADYPEALENTKKIADSCHFDFNFKTYHFPKFVPPEHSKSLEEYLTEKVYQGFEERWPLIAHHLGEKVESEKPRYLERIEEELKTIISMGFASYFLIVADFINYAKSQNIPVGPGRGSAAGSLVAYCLKITDLDPLPYNLIFERFLNPERISMPDMDIDFCMNRRDEVIAYVTEKYGHVSQIITFGKMKAKAVIRDVGRVLDMPYGEVDRIAKLIPNALNITLEEALKTEPRLEELRRSDFKVQTLLNVARSLEGLNRHASTHAAGVVIAGKSLTEFMPLYRGSHEEIVTQFDMKAVEKIGLVKFDFLGLKTLTVIEDALKIIRRTREISLNIIEIPLDDPLVYKTFCSGDGLGIFQLESSGMRDLLVKLKPNCFEDIIALVALYRPGPLGSGMVDDFINRKHGRTSITYELPQLESILKDTYGVIVYQEQVMQIASALAGFSLGEADLLRRAMGKKKPEEMAQQRERFVEGALKNKVPKKKAEKIFDLMAKFAEYGFNKSHSAAYALISYQTAYLKTHYTSEYMASLLTHEMGDTDKILVYINDLQSHGISVLPPDVNESFRHFSVLSEKEMRFGLAAVKNVGEAAIESIIEARNRVGRFESFFHFCEEIDQRRVNRKVIESLIKCGAFDNLGIRRSQAFTVLDAALGHGSSKQRDRIQGQNSLFDQIAGQKMAPAIPSIEEWPEHERLKLEKEAIGFYITGHPLKGHEEQIRKVASVDTLTIRNVVDKLEVSIAGMVSALKEITTKKGDRMAFVSLEDLKGSLEVVVFADLYKNSQELLKKEEPLLIRGLADLNEESVKLLANQIYALKNMNGSAKKAVRIRVASENLSEDKLKDFKLLLSRYPGDSPVYLHLISGEQKETILKLPRELEAEWNGELEGELKNILGSDVRILI